MKRIVYFVGIVAFFLFSTGKIFAQVPTQAFSVCSTDTIRTCYTDQNKALYFNRILTSIQAMQNWSDQSKNNCPIKDYGKLQEGQVNDFYNQCWNDPYGNGIEARGEYFSLIEQGCGCFLANESEPLYKEDFIDKLVIYLSTSNTGTPPPNTPTPEKGFIPTPSSGYLEGYKAGLDQAAAGSKGGVCVAGDIELDGVPPPDFSEEAGLLDKLGPLGGIIQNAINLPSTIKEMASYFGVIRTTITTTDFCPIDKESAIAVFSIGDQEIPFTLDQDRAAQKVIFNSKNKEITLPELNKALDEVLQDSEETESSSTFTPEQLRLVNAKYILLSTENMDYAQKDQTLKRVQSLLAGNGEDTSISCNCKDKSLLQQQALEQQGSETLGVSTTIHGSVLQASAPSIEGICGNLFLTPTPAPGAAPALSSYLVCLQDMRDFCSKYDRNLASCASKIVDHCGIANIGCILTSTKYISAARNTCGPLHNISPSEYTKCIDCGLFNAGVWTSVGCIYSDFSKTIDRLFTIALGFGGLAALGCIIYASFIMQTSAGNPEKTKKAQELITSCIAGLILIIFSVFILRVIGVDILRIPGLS